MNILFLTLLDFQSLDERNIYTDLLREFVKNSDNVYVVSPAERRTKQKTHIVEQKNSQILKVKIGNITKTNILEKGLSTISIEKVFIKAIKKYFSNIKFDMILYSTPPITFAKVVEYVKERDQAQTYLLLKDIFPQNAVDMGMLSKSGVKSVIYKYFRNKEKELYKISDRIGCMSQANVDYVLKHNPEVAKEKVEVCPNCIDVQDMRLSEKERITMREKYHIPQDKMVFVYGGNLGKPQGIPFIIDCLKTQEQNEDVYFLIVGDGTEYSKLENYLNTAQPQNVKLMRRMPKEDYDRMIAACDIGMIFLDHRFTIPNFPSRLLSYMQAGLPVLACTDPNTDIGKVIVEGGFGWWCESNNCKAIFEIINSLNNKCIKMCGEKSYSYLKNNFQVELEYDVIVKNL